MTATGPSPELILSLSRDQVSIHLLENNTRGLQAWQSSYPVTGLYLQEEIANVFDRALGDNPSLFEEFACVHLVIRDRPNLVLPASLKQQGSIASVASRYLRVRAGDALKVDESLANDVVCYSLPRSAMFTVSEYFSDITNVHVVSLLWNEIQQSTGTVNEKSVYYCLTGKTLIVLATENDKRYFSKIIDIHHQDDVQYYVIACNRLLRPAKKVNIQMQDDASPFLMLYSPHTPFDQWITFPSVPALLQRHFPCAS